MSLETTVITDSVIQSAIQNAVGNVCHTMIKHDAIFVNKMPAGFMDQQIFEVVGTVGFLGNVNGLVYLCLSAEFAREATGHILGMSLAEVEAEGLEVVKDAIGEVTNMTAGVFKNALCNLGFPCKLTLPTITRGTKLQLATTKGSERHTFRFQCAGRDLIADVQMRPN